MELSPSDATDLARFVARRYPDRHQVDALSRKAGILLEATLAGDMVSVWSTVIVEARIQGRVRRLARVLARDDRARNGQQDERLQEVCDLLLALEGPSPVQRAAPLLGLGLVLVVVASVGGWSLGRRAVSPAPDAPAAAAPAPVEVVPTAVVAAAPAPVEVAPTPVEVAPTPSPVLAAPAPTPARSSAATGRCMAPAGELVGYWYAGRQAPGAQGETITLRSGITVRADYPDLHNGYNARAAERCALVAGDRVHLSRAPVLVPGRVYWVPLAGGDLL